MVRLACRQKLAVLVLSLTLLTPWSAEALPRSLQVPSDGVGARLLKWFTILLGDIGCSADPDGRCRDTNASQTPAPSDHLDIGCSADSSGSACNHG